MDSKQLFTDGEIQSQASPTTTARVKRAVLLDKCSGQRQRRCSPRLKDIPQSKRPYYGTSLKVSRQQQLLHQQHHNDDDHAFHAGVQDAGCNLNHVIQVNDVDVDVDVNVNVNVNVNGEPTIPATKLEYKSAYVEKGDPLDEISQNAAGGDSVNDSGTTSLDDTSSAGNEAGDLQCTPAEASNNNLLQSYSLSLRGDGKSSHAMVKATTGTFDAHHLQPVQGEQIMQNKEEGNLQNDTRDLNPTVFFTKKHTLVASPKFRGMLLVDISGGQEEIKIPVINLVDDTPFAATGFTYSRSIQVAENVDLPPNADGCRCKGNCIHPKFCACARLNDSKFPYVRHNGGRLRKAKDVVFECGPNCGCGPDCINRISQRGIKYQLEQVFRTLDRGWAVRTKDFIPSGAPVCEYVGILRRTDELDKVDVNDYIFEIDCLHTIKGIEGRERRFGAVSASLCDNIEKIEDGYLEKTPEFCIDANHIGNVSRFVNHSCEPNLFVQCILSSHHDFRLARIVLFAARSISPWQELTYDYGYPLDSVIGSDGEVKVQPCYCGAEDCRKRLY
ncbi:histone-lysine N-methyltransferase, H3 lysine-9 specific SUVH4 [Coffea arabica]|uniref:Histone-lysine N-methyltransferase, H3 lysine-9 specific SUVH4 n=1 Tax=Coffea arabica TaxID=13443 RepID=A0ABM4W5C2_COFAR